MLQHCYFLPSESGHIIFSLQSGHVYFILHVVTVGKDYRIGGVGDSAQGRPEYNSSEVVRMVNMRKYLHSTSTVLA